MNKNVIVKSLYRDITNEFIPKDLKYYSCSSLYKLLL